VGLAAKVCAARSLIAAARLFARLRGGVARDNRFTEEHYFFDSRLSGKR
jgi:hypothetical protein